MAALRFLCDNSINIAPVRTRQNGLEPCNHRHARVRPVTLVIRTTIATPTRRLGSLHSRADKTACVLQLKLFESSSYSAFPHGKFSKPSYLRRHRIQFGAALIHCVKLPALGRNGTQRGILGHVKVGLILFPPKPRDQLIRLSKSPVLVMLFPTK